MIGVYNEKNELEHVIKAIQADVDDPEKYQTSIKDHNGAILADCGFTMEMNVRAREIFQLSLKAASRYTNTLATIYYGDGEFDVVSDTPKSISHTYKNETDEDAVYVLHSSAPVYIYSNTLNHSIIPCKSLTFSGNSEFKSLYFLQPETLYVGDDVTQLGGNTSLSNIQLCAVCSLDNVTRLRIPSQVKSIHTNWLESSTHIPFITVDRTNTHFLAEEGCLFSTPTSEGKSNLYSVCSSDMTTRNIILPPDVSSLSVLKGALRDAGQSIVFPEHVPVVFTTRSLERSSVEEITCVWSNTSSASAFMDSRIRKIHPLNTDVYREVVSTKDCCSALLSNNSVIKYLREGPRFWSTPDSLYLKDVHYVSPEAFAYSGTHSTSVLTLSFSNTLYGIYSEAFYQARNLKIVGCYPESVQSRAFYNADISFEKTFTKNMARMEDYAFYGSSIPFAHCDKLTSTEISSYAFDGCSHLESVILGKDITTIELNAFRGCTSLTSVYYTGTPEQKETLLKNMKAGNDVLKTATWYFYSEGLPATGYTYWKYGKDDLPVIWETTATPGLTFEKIDNDTVRVININPEIEGATELHVVIPAQDTEGRTVVEIGSMVVSNHDVRPKIATVKLPSTIRKIHKQAFLGCTNLTTINIPENVESIGTEAFLGCHSLEQLIIPSSVTTMGCNIATECQSLQKLTLPMHDFADGENVFLDFPLPYIFGNWSGENITSVNYEYDSQNIRFSLPSQLQTIRLTNINSNLPDCIFRNCSTLKNISLEGYVNISKYMFTGCTNLRTISGTSVLQLNNGTLILNNPNVMDHSFQECLQIQKLQLTGVESIAQYAFYECSGVTEITIDCSYISSIGTHAFSVPNDARKYKLYLTSTPSITESDLWEKWLAIELDDETSSPLRYASEIYNNEKLVTSIRAYSIETLSSYSLAHLPENIESVYLNFYGVGSKIQSFALSSNPKVTDLRITPHGYWKYDETSEVPIWNSTVNVQRLCYNDSAQFIGDKELTLMRLSQS